MSPEILYEGRYIAVHIRTFSTFEGTFVPSYCTYTYAHMIASLNSLYCHMYKKYVKM